MNEFDESVSQRVRGNARNTNLNDAAQAFLTESLKASYSYNFSWLSRPIIQYPQDIVAVQELVWSVRPDLIIETGIAHGGSLILSASLLALLDLTDAVGNKVPFRAEDSHRRVIGIDVDIRPHNRDAIHSHPLSPWIRMIEGSSIDASVIDVVRKEVSAAQKVMVMLDSNHTHDHVLKELEIYGPLTSVGSYCGVFDTVIETNPAASVAGRPWGTGNNPLTAVHEFLNHHPEFVLDPNVENKFLVTVAPGGFLKRLH